LLAACLWVAVSTLIGLCDDNRNCVDHLLACLFLELSAASVRWHKPRAIVVVVALVIVVVVIVVLIGDCYCDWD